MTKEFKIKLTISKIEKSIRDALDESDSSGTLAKTPTETKKGADVATIYDADVDVVDDSKLIYQTEIETSGKISRKATWDDLCRFTGKKVDSDLLRDWILKYQEKCYPEDLSEANHTPQICYIKDEEGGETLFKDFGWKPIKLNLKPGVVDVKERWTKKVTLESFDLDSSSTNADKILSLDECDKKITSSLRRSKISGHPLALEMLETEPEFVTEFKGIGSSSAAFGGGVFGNDGGPGETDEDTGCKVWKDTKTLRALLRDTVFPTRGGGNSGGETRFTVTANETYVKARVYYRAFFTNGVVCDHKGKFRDMRYWKFPFKFLLQYNDLPNSVFLHEDIELRFFTDVGVSMNTTRDEGDRFRTQEKPESE